MKLYVKIIVAAAAGLLLSSCHPFYNTFYNAEEAYKSSKRKHAKVMRNYPDSIVIKPSEEMAAGYDRAIEKSLKMMELFPKDRKHQDRAHFLMGRASFYKMDFEVTVSRMRDLQTDWPQSKLLPQARLYTAKAHIMMDNLQIAEELLLQILSDHPELDKNHEVTMLLVEVATRRGGRAHALGLLENIKLTGLPIEKRIEIILRMADLQYELGQPKRALGILANAPMSKMFPYLMYRVDRSRYFCYDAMDSLDVALRHLTGMERNRRYRDQRDEIRYYTAVTLRRMGRQSEAIVLLEEIREKCGKAVKSDTITLCGRAAYELANIYLAMGKLDKAMEVFAEAGAARDSAMATRANARLIALQKLLKLREPDSTGAVPIEARYSIAEIFQFDLDAPDSARFYYMEIAAAPDADSIIRPRAMLMAAMVIRETGDTARADSLFTAVIEEYGGTEFARRAQIEKDIEVTVITAIEAAERDFRAAESLLETNAVEAVKAFYAVYKNHPDIEDVAARSLYAAAWYSDNHLNRKRAALTFYEELCDKYPESSHCKINAMPRIKITRDSMEVRKKRRDEAKAKAEVITDTSTETAPTDSSGISTPVPAIKKEDNDDDDDGGDDDDDEI